MSVIKCKMCGGNLEITQGSTVAECEYCGSIQTLPRVSDERLAGLYERANDLRMCNEFDEAIKVYEKIIDENPQDSDAYWSMALCKYGVNYVEEMKGAPRKPTINRAQLTPIVNDVNYLSAVKYADDEQKKVYEEEAAKIDRILRRYMEISRREKPYDVFICYKESDENGERTLDSVRAGEIYRKLVKEGFNVFFAPVSLKSLLGEEYEPYIFAAIQSAKVMLVIGTKPEYLNAVWVKNEWSRFLALAKDDGNKKLIPVYAEMDPYDMPEAFKYKQAQNMEDIGFELDLINGIEKLVRKNEPQKEARIISRRNEYSAPENTDKFLQRIEIFLDNHDWHNANIYCEKVLDISPRNEKAHFYKLLIEARVTNEVALENIDRPLETLRAYQNAVRYTDEATTDRLIEMNQSIKSRLKYEQEEAKISSEIDDMSSRLSSQKSEKTWLEEQLASTKEKIANLQKHKSQLFLFAALTLVDAIIIFSMLSSEAFEAWPIFWIAQFFFAMRLAKLRGQNRFKAFLVVLFTVGLIPAFAAFKGLIEAFKLSVTPLRNEQANCENRLKRLEDGIVSSRRSLEELNSKKHELESDKV